MCINLAFAFRTEEFLYIHYNSTLAVPNVSKNICITPDKYTVFRPGNSLAISSTAFF